MHVTLSDAAFVALIPRRLPAHEARAVLAAFRADLLARVASGDPGAWAMLKAVDAELAILKT